ncbi:MAG: hypothetical protein AAGD32_13720 [Planctomycetota bacterium]
MPETAAPLTDTQKQELFRSTAESLEARQAYAASRAEVLNPLLTHESTIRSIFAPETVAAGDAIRYDIPFDDIECAWVMPQIGAVPSVQFEMKEVYVNTFGIDGGVEYQIDVAKDARFAVGELATTLLMNNFVRQEELAGWNLIKAHAAVLTADQIVVALDDNGATAGDQKLNIHTISEVITKADELGVGGRRVTDIYCSPRRFADLRNNVLHASLPDDMKMQAWGARREAGNEFVPEIRFHKVYNSALVDDDTAYAFTQKDGFRYGVMPIRDTLVTYDNPVSILERKIGIIGWERLGLGILDDKGLMKIDFTKPAT